MSTIILIAILLAIAIGYKFKFNIGLVAMGLAYLIGTYGAAITPKELIAMWPVSLFFTLFAITFFYGFAISNGTLVALASRIIYSIRNKPALIPFALFFSCALLAGIGPGSIALFGFFAPLFMSIAKETEMSPALATVILGAGASAGAWSPIAVNGVMTKKIIEQAGYAANVSGAYANHLWFNLIIACLVLFLVSYFVFRGHKLKPTLIEKPAPLNRVQLINMWLIGLMVACIVIPSVLSWATNIKIFSIINSGIDVTLLAILFCSIALLFKLGDEKKALSNVPWGVIILVCGMGVLIAVAVKVGTVKALSTAIGNNVSLSAIPYVMSLVAAAMSFFSSTMGVVIPTLFPIVHGIATKLTADPSVMFSAIAIGAVFTGFSPFSTLGALAMGSLLDESKRNRLFWELIGVPIGAVLILLLLITVGIIR